MKNKDTVKERFNKEFISGTQIMIGGVSAISRQNKDQESSLKQFNSVQEAESANLPKGTEISINGRRAVIE